MTPKKFFANWVLVFGSIASKVFFNSNNGLTVAPVVTLGSKATNPALGKILDSPITQKAKSCRIQRRGRGKGRKGSTVSIPSKISDPKVSNRRNTESSSIVVGSRQKKKDGNLHVKRQAASVYDDSEQDADPTNPNQDTYNEPIPPYVPLC
ncbi:hypothetical protein DSO57_1007788 [Entomophthora muscae]|uniref:Uncharacterized protein n=1 Tax=Entomophthora muscae TaxID=34485 RepID=A0ACC2RLX0_9FUNG|nr:hypothetical protein DSO57_1007788 [Entomophthora muscae]